MKAGCIYCTEKGKDYFTDDEIKEIIDSVLEKIPTPEDGKDGRDGSL